MENFKHQQKTSKNSNVNKIKLNGKRYCKFNLHIIQVYK